MSRAVVIVLDSVGVGGAPDAAEHGDDGADTLGHIAERCADGTAGSRRPSRGRLRLPNLVALGIGEACRIATGRIPPGLEGMISPNALYGSACETSLGKDTPSGHWELAGVSVEFEWHRFPATAPCFPDDLIDVLCRRAELPGILGNRHASGTEIIAELGAQHIESGKPICYTSADSVFQIAAHERHFGLARLYEVCRIARELTRPLRVGRVIARPFVGEAAGPFVRTANRRDLSEPPPRPTILDTATAAGRDVVSLGKTADIFAHAGTGRVVRGHGNDSNMELLVREIASLGDGGLLFANLVDFDSEFGHRRDVAGYAGALERFDAGLPALIARLRPGDLVIITADHGCDPTWPGTDHTREQVPILAFGPAVTGGSIGRRQTFADVAASVVQHLDLVPVCTGRSFL